MDCVLITNEFPYRKAEIFLVNEIEYLARAFERVLIFPICVRDDEEIRYSLPENVMIFPLNALDSKRKYVVFTLSGLADQKIKLDGKSIKEKLGSAYSKGRAFDAFQRIINIINSFNIELNDVVVYSYWFSYQAMVAWMLKVHLLSQGKKVKAFSRAHGYDLYWERNKLYYLPFQEQSLKELDGVAPCSNNGMQYLHEKHPKYIKKINTAYLGTTDYGIGIRAVKEKIIFLTCSWLTPIKRLTMFAEAFVKLCKVDDRFYWVCVGDGIERDCIEKIIVNNGLMSKVDFLGFLSNDKVMAYYKNNPISYFCNVSLNEGLPVSIMEAMSFGIPVIATNVGGSGEIVDDTTGVLLPAELDSGCLADAILNEVRKGEEIYQKKRIMAREKWESCFSAEKNYQEWVQRIKG